MLNPFLVYLVLDGVRGLGLGLLIVAPIYRIETAGFGPLELVLAGTALEIGYFACEVPTGIVADVYSRRLSCILGAVVMGGAWLLEGLVPSIWPIMIAQALLGAGWTFFSGAAEAWVAGELGEDGAAHAIVRGKQANLAAGVLGMIAGAGLGHLHLNWPIVAAGLSHLALAVFLLAAMPELGFVKHAHETRRAAFLSTFLGGTRAIRGNPVLMTILAAVFLAGMASEGIDRLWEAHLWEDIALPELGSLPQLYWFAIVGGVATMLSVPALSLARRWVERESDRALALTVTTLAASVAVFTALFGLAGGALLAAACYWGVRVARNVAEPAYTVWVVRNTDPAVRATVLSMEGQSHSIGEIASGPPLGIIGRAISIPAALLASSALQALALPLLLRAAARARRSTAGPLGTPSPVTPGGLRPSGPPADPAAQTEVLNQPPPELDR